MNVLEAKALKKSFGGVKALIRGDIYCPEGKICGLLGANGSGKTTFSKIITGMLTPDEGELIVNGKPVSFKSPLDAKKEGIVMVHQHLSLIPDFTVWQNINIGHESLTKTGFIDWKKCMQTSKSLIDKFCPGLSLDKKVSELLPSEQQLVEIAKAVSQNPKLLILDEPTASLEQSQVVKVFNALRELKEMGTSMIFISHRLWEVKEICDFIVVFRNGENVGSVDFEQEGKNEKKIVSLITGNDALLTIKKRAENTSSVVMMEVEHLSYKNKLADISFSIKKGEVIGIGGLQGQGQEELLLVLSGLVKPDEGRIKIDNKQVKLDHPSDAIRNGVVLVPGDRQKEGLFIQHSIFMNMVCSSFVRKGARWFIPFKKHRKEIEEIISRLSIKTDGIDTELRKLSGGNQQKVVVGKWLPHNPKILLLSDPAKGVDVQAKKDLYDVVTDLAGKGTSVILFASDNEELISYCDRLFIMYEGKIVEEIRNEEINEKHLVAVSLRAEIH